MNKTTKYSMLVLGLALTIATGCKKDKTPPTVPSVTTAALTNISTTSATAGGTITSDGGAAITASGIVLSSANNMPTLADTVFSGTTATGSFTTNLTNLEFGTTYYIRAYATNSVGTGYGSVVTMNTTNDTTKVRFTYIGQTVTYGIIVSSTTGKKWMDRNLGANAVATSLTDAAGYGHLFQWGRLIDGHQLRTADTTRIFSSSDVPGHNKFIYGNFVGWALDWRNPQNNNLWQGSARVNNPCPTGWHVPTKAEWDAEGITDPNSGYSALKLTLAGYRDGGDGILYPSTVGTQGQYWTSTPDSFIGGAYGMNLFPGNTRTSIADRAHGRSIRCIKD